jgi:error-prone DNA polymerase
VAGIVLVRQRPGAGNVTFVTIEDETGVANIIVWQRLFDTYRRVVLGSAMIGVKGRVQREGAVIHVICDRLEDMTPFLHAVAAMDFPHRTGPGDGAKFSSGPDPRHPKPAPPAALPAPAVRQAVIEPRSRNFH